MKASEIVISITVSCRAAVMNGLDIVGLNHGAVAALGGLNGWGWAAHVDARLLNFGQTKTVGWREVPLFARREASHNLKLVVLYYKIRRVVVFQVLCFCCKIKNMRTEQCFSTGGL